MGVLAVDGLMLREPNLLTPCLKPIGVVKIDAAHPMTRNLLRFDLFGNAGATSRELVAGAVDPFVLSSNAMLVGTRYGLGLYSGANGSINGASDPNDAIRLKVTTKLTVVLLIMMNTTHLVSDFAYGNTAQGGDYNWGLYALQTGPMNFYVKSVSATGPSLLSEHLNRAVVYAGTYDGSNVYAWGNGAKGAPAARTGNANTADLAISVFNWTSNLTPNTGTVFFGAVWNRVLDDGELISISADPYQFLVPA